MDNNERVTKVYNGERCKHGMIFEYCATCQEYKVNDEVRFPIEITDKVTGELKTIWLEREVTRVYYRQYRRSSGNSQHVRPSTKLKDLGLRSVTPDRAIKLVNDANRDKHMKSMYWGI